MTTTILPIITIQPDFTSVISDVFSGFVPEDIFWISCYKVGFPSVHAKVRVTLDEVDRERVKYDVREGNVNFERAENYITIACPPLEIAPTTIMLPGQEYADPDRSDPQRPHRITAFDVAPDGSQFATAFRDGSTQLYHLPSPSLLFPYASAKPHLSTTTTLRFFPSSRVLLSSGLDFALTVLPAEPHTFPAVNGNSASIARHNVPRVTPARVLRGHKRSVTSTAIIDRGRTVLSGSKDGTVCLWHVGEARQIRSWVLGGSAVEAMCIGERYHGGDQVNGTESETDGGPDIILFCALANGSFAIIALADTSVNAVFNSPIPASQKALNAIAYDKVSGMVATGSVDGKVNLWDARGLSTSSEGESSSRCELLASFQRNDASIEDLAFLSSTESQLLSDENAAMVIIATADGLPYVVVVARMEAPAPPSGLSDVGSRPLVRVHAEIISGECDGVRVVRALPGTGGQREIWTAGDDGIVRQYYI